MAFVMMCNGRKPVCPRFKMSFSHCLLYFLIETDDSDVPNPSCNCNDKEGTLVGFSEVPTWLVYGGARLQCPPKGTTRYTCKNGNPMNVMRFETSCLCIWYQCLHVFQVGSRVICISWSMCNIYVLVCVICIKYIIKSLMWFQSMCFMFNNVKCRATKTA